MRTAFISLLASVSVLSLSTAFSPSISSICNVRSSSSCYAAKSAAEDLELTLKVIMENLVDDNSGIDDSDDDAPYTPPASSSPVAAAPSSSGVELWSVDYDAAAKLAYKAAGSNGDFGSFKMKYLADTSAMIAKKNPFK